jgi:hypothetical protein
MTRLENHLFGHSDSSPHPHWSPPIQTTIKYTPVITSTTTSSSPSIITSNSFLTSHHISLFVSYPILKLAHSQEYIDVHVTQTNIKSKMDLLANSIKKFISSIGIADTSEQAMDASSN